MGDSTVGPSLGKGAGTGAEGWSAFDAKQTMTPQRRRATVLLALGMLIDGYDLLAIGGAVLFLKPYFHLNSGETGLVSFMGFLGAAIGMLVVGDLADRFGRRAVFVINLIVFVLFAVLSAFVTNVPELMAMRFLMGLGIGADVPTSMSYIAEVAPAESRGFYLGGFTQIVWVCGAFLATLVALVAWPLAGDEAWRWVFGLGAIPALVVLLLRQGVPESPRWLARHGQTEKATASLRWMGLVEQPGMFAGSRQAGSRQEGSGSYRDLFRRGYRLRIAMTSSIFILVGFSGGVTSVAAPFVFHYFGLLGVTGSLGSSLLVWFVSLIGALITAPLFDRYGRVKIGVVVASVTTVALLVMGLFGKGDPPVLMVTYFVVAIGNWAGSGVWWTLSAELFPTDIRGRAQGIANGACRLAVGADVYLISMGAAALGFGGVILVFAVCPLAMAVILGLSRRWEPGMKTLEEASAEAPADQRALADPLAPLDAGVERSGAL